MLGQSSPIATDLSLEPGVTPRLAMACAACQGACFVYLPFNFLGKFHKVLCTNEVRHRIALVAYYLSR